MRGEETWIDQHTAPNVPSTLAAIGTSILEQVVLFGGAGYSVYRDPPLRE